MPEIELYCCGVKIKVFKHIIDEFNYHTQSKIKHCDSVEPEFLTNLNIFIVKLFDASQQTQLIIDRMKETA